MNRINSETSEGENHSKKMKKRMTQNKSINVYSNTPQPQSLKFDIVNKRHQELITNLKDVYPKEKK